MVAVGDLPREELKAAHRRRLRLLEERHPGAAQARSRPRRPDAARRRSGRDRRTMRRRRCRSAGPRTRTATCRKASPRAPQDFETGALAERARQAALGAGQQRLAALRLAPRWGATSCSTPPMLTCVTADPARPGLAVGAGRDLRRDPAPGAAMASPTRNTRRAVKALKAAGGGRGRPGADHDRRPAGAEHRLQPHPERHLLHRRGGPAHRPPGAGQAHPREGQRRVRPGLDRGRPAADRAGRRPPRRPRRRCWPPGRLPRPAPPPAAAGRTSRATPGPTPSFGPPGQVVSREALPDIGATRIAFANGVRMNFKSSQNAQDRVEIRIRFGAGQEELGHAGPAGRAARRDAAARGRARQERLRGHRALLRGPRLRFRPRRSAATPSRSPAPPARPTSTPSCS